MKRYSWCAFGLTVALATTMTAQAPQDPHRRLFSLGDFTLESGTTLPNATVAYAIFGTLNAQRTNAVLIPSWYGSDHHGYDFLIGAGRSLDPAKYFIVATEMFANGFSSSPSNTPPPFDGPRFPAVAIRDNVEAARRLLTSELGITHLRAIVGFSMGAQQAFQWAVSHPDFIDAIVPYCGTAKTYPHGVVRLEGAISALTADAAFNDGNYTSPPAKGLAAWSRHWAGWVWSQEWWRRELFKPQFASVDAVLANRTARDAVRDANNLISQARTWQRHNVGDTPGFNGDHERALGSIKVPVLYMPCETDLYFPIGDFRYEQQFLKRSTLTPVPSLWGHSAGSGGNPADTQFIDAQILRFLASSGNSSSQAQPDFSGTWTAEPPPPAAGAAGGAQGGARGDMGSGWGSTIVVAQDAAQLSIEYALYSRYDLQPPIKLTYSLDGSESRNQLMVGRGSQAQSSRAAWNGQALRITTSSTLIDPASGKTLTTEVTHRLSLESPTSLVVEVVRAGVLGGQPTTTRTIYKKN